MRGTVQMFQILSRNKIRTDRREGCWLSIGVETFVFQFAFQTYQDQDKQNCNFYFCFVRV